MEQGAERHVSASQEILKKKYAKKLLTLIKVRGVNHLRIDDIVKFMDISKATFYKYFTSKEDIIEQVVELIVGYLAEATMQVYGEGAPNAQRFQTAFENSLLVMSLVSEAFIHDLEQCYPELWQRIRSGQMHYYHNLRQFYTQGIVAGVFQPVNPHLLVLQEEQILRVIMDPIFLVEHDLTLRKALYDFYTLQKYLVLTPEARATLDDTLVNQHIEAIAHKLAMSMR